jgi:hypothetical protein
VQGTTMMIEGSVQVEVDEMREAESRRVTRGFKLLRKNRLMNDESDRLLSRTRVASIDRRQHLEGVECESVSADEVGWKQS